MYVLLYLLVCTYIQNSWQLNRAALFFQTSRSIYNLAQWWYPMKEKGRRRKKKEDTKKRVCCAVNSTQAHPALDRKIIVVAVLFWKVFISRTFDAEFRVPQIFKETRNDIEINDLTWINFSSGCCVLKVRRTTTSLGLVWLIWSKNFSF